MAKAILIADDSEDDILLFRRIAEKAGLKNPLIVFQDGAETIAYLSGDGPFADREKHPLPAILFLDLKMSRVHGQEVLRWLQGRAHLRGIQVFVLSHLNDPKTFASVYGWGAKSFLTKPVTLAELQNLIRAFPGHWEPSAISSSPTDSGG